MGSHTLQGVTHFGPHVLVKLLVIPQFFWALFSNRLDRQSLWRANVFLFHSQSFLLPGLFWKKRAGKLAYIERMIRMRITVASHFLQYVYTNLFKRGASSSTFQFLHPSALIYILCKLFESLDKFSILIVELFTSCFVSTPGSYLKKLGHDQRNYIFTWPFICPRQDCSCFLLRR